MNEAQKGQRGFVVGGESDGWEVEVGTAGFSVLRLPFIFRTLLQVKALRVVGGGRSSRVEIVEVEKRSGRREKKVGCLCKWVILVCRQGWEQEVGVGGSGKKVDVGKFRKNVMTVSLAQESNAVNLRGVGPF